MARTSDSFRALVIAKNKRRKSAQPAQPQVETVSSSAQQEVASSRSRPTAGQGEIVTDDNVIGDKETAEVVNDNDIIINQEPDVNVNDVNINKEPAQPTAIFAGRPGKYVNCRSCGAKSIEQVRRSDMRRVCSECGELIDPANVMWSVAAGAVVDVERRRS